MKTLIKSIFIIALSFSFLGCSDNKKSKSDVKSLASDIEKIARDMEDVSRKSLTFNGSTFDINKLDTLSRSELITEKELINELKSLGNQIFSKVNQVLQSSDFEEARSELSYEQREQLDDTIDALNSLDLEGVYSPILDRIDLLLG